MKVLLSRVRGLGSTIAPHTSGEIKVLEQIWAMDGHMLSVRDLIKGRDA